MNSHMPLTAINQQIGYIHSMNLNKQTMPLNLSFYSHLPMHIDQANNFFTFQNKILQIRKSCSLSNYVVNLMLFFFYEEELTMPNVNVNGKNKVMQPLDPVCINQIRTLCMEGFQIPIDQQIKQWTALHVQKKYFLKKIKNFQREN